MALQSTTALATVNLQGAASEVTFSGIPNTYRDLILIVSGTSSALADTFIRLNADNANYSIVRAYGTGSSYGSDTQSDSRIGDMNTTQANIKLQIMDYSATDKHKTFLSNAASPANSVIMTAGRWASINAVTSLQVYLASQTFAAGTIMRLYGRIA